MRRFYRLRARLVPYIATMQRVAHDTGVQVVRPAYYEWPECSKVRALECVWLLTPVGRLLSL